MPNIDELVKGARDAISVKRVYGDPIESEGVTIVPAAVVRGGGGGGGDSEDNGGGGFGLHARPAGAWVLRDGDAAWRPAVDVNRIVLLVFVLGFLFATTSDVPPNPPRPRAPRDGAGARAPRRSGPPSRWPSSR